MKLLFLFIIAVLPVIILGYFIYKKDKNKEPLRLLTKLFLSGILSCLIVFLLGIIFPIFRINTIRFNYIQTFFYNLIYVALIEESLKWIMLYLVSYKSKEFDELYDMIVYAVFVSLGFAFFENLLYVIPEGIKVGILRGFLAIPGHVSDAIFMGHYLGLSKLYLNNKNYKYYKKNFILSLIIPILLHAVYDFLLSTNLDIYLTLFFIFVPILYVYSYRKVLKVSKEKIKINNKLT